MGECAQGNGVTVMHDRAAGGSPTDVQAAEDMQRLLGAPGNAWHLAGTEPGCMLRRRTCHRRASCLRAPTRSCCSKSCRLFRPACCCCMPGPRTVTALRLPLPWPLERSVSPLKMGLPDQNLRASKAGCSGMCKDSGGVPLCAHSSHEPGTQMPWSQS